jgi:NADP-dependent 3-hydroxy acid dehydrogenase YdfG
MSSNIEGKVVVITGASSGLGEATARHLVGEGAKLVLGARRLDRIQALAQELNLGTDAAVETDVTDREQVKRLVDAAVAAHGRIDVIINNAGLMPHSPLERGKVDDWDRMIDVNLKGVLYTAAATLPHLIESGEGDFVSLASVAGVRAFPGEAVYNASKFGQVGFTRALDHELREKGVRATSICPGGVHTEFAIGSGREHDDPELEGMLTPDEVADVVLFAVTRPRSMRILTTTFRPMGEGSFG